MVSERIRDLRKAREMTQIDVAEAAGLSVLGFQRVERGETIPRPETLKAIAGALGVTESEIIGNREPQKPAYTQAAIQAAVTEALQNLSTDPLTSDEKQLLNLFRSAPNEIKVVVLKTVNNLIQRK